MTQDARRCISPPFGGEPAEGVVIADDDGEQFLFKPSFQLDTEKAASSSLREDYPELIERCADDETAILYWPWFREFVIPVLDGGPGAIIIDFDPFTGKALPRRLRDAWFEALEAELGREIGIFDEGIPEEFRGEDWWINRKL